MNLPSISRQKLEGYYNRFKEALPTIETAKKYALPVLAIAGSAAAAAVAFAKYHPATTTQRLSNTAIPLPADLSALFNQAEALATSHVSPPPSIPLPSIEAPSFAVVGDQVNKIKKRIFHV